MYKCEECGLIFEKPRKYIDDTGEKLLVCPDCIGDYEEIHQCECGEIISIDEKMCKNCKKDTIVKFKGLLKQFDEEQLEYINEYYEGEEIR